MSDFDIKLSKLLMKNRAYRNKAEALIAAKISELQPIKIPAKNPSERTIYFLRKNTKLAREILSKFEKLTAATKALCLKQKKPRDLWLPTVIDCPRKIQIRSYTASKTMKISMETARDLLRKEGKEWGVIEKTVLNAFSDRIYIRYVTGLKYDLKVEKRFDTFSLPVTPWVICLIQNQVPVIEFKRNQKTYTSKVAKLKNVFFEDETRKAYILPELTKTKNVK